MTEIPRNTYRVSDDPRVEDLVNKCVNGFEGHKGLVDADEVFINLCPISDQQKYHDISCGGDGRIAVAERVLEHFAEAGYHCALGGNGYTYLWAKIHKKPIDREGYNVKIIS